MLTLAKMRMVCVLKIVISVALLLAAQTYAQTNKEKALPRRTNPVPRIDGYGPYKFGLSIGQAQEARPQAKGTEGNCGYDSINAAYCLTETTKLFGQDARIDVLFDKNTKTLSNIIIRFDRFKGNEKACSKALEAIATPLFQKWGTPTREEGNGAQLFWESAYGGTLMLFGTCFTDDIGFFVVSYENTPGF